MPDTLTLELLRTHMEKILVSQGLTVSIKDYKVPACPTVAFGEPFVITLRGGDQQGLIAAFSGVIAGFGVNIVNLKAIFQQQDSSQVVIVFEVEVPQDVERLAFRQALRYQAEEFGANVNVQHRDIFEAIHRL